MSNLPGMTRRLLWVAVFGVAFALVEASVVVYLRSLYYPEGFTLPLKAINPAHLTVELLREAATIVMLVAVGALAGSGGWERFAYFLVGFGVWDLFYYIWLKAFLDWPERLTDWDILFLLPVPWIGPVIAPVLISLVMIASGTLVVARLEQQKFFRPGLLSWGFSVLGTAIILFSFVADTRATLQLHQPEPYRYGFLAVGLALYGVAIVVSCMKSLAVSRE